MARKTAEETERTRQQILKGARDLFIRKGYNAASMEDIRKHANVSKGSIYYHFKSKHQLLMEIFEQKTIEWIEGWQKIVKPGMTPVEKLYALADYWQEDFDDPFLKVVDEFLTSQGVDTGTFEKMIELVQMQYPVIQSIIEEGIASGEFKRDDPAELTYIFASTMGGLGMTYYEKVPRERARAIYRKAAELFIRGISAK
ncbi:transcriptional regulator [Thermobacillus composti KWC4]|uniref:Transcriptional regulator n=1 Tax=Thermobacillus composti (strain DSM 18247 / JCM 13945 / KWC4) TaxID=717605 RepID=L0EBY3_THECK|nr:TetR family transcriptional regulator C-terminal domain-containing protein [Thermobacillus composti]AGA56680.1 transcriptional regulator [Thermobacillus composti KWC4]